MTTSGEDHTDDRTPLELLLNLSVYAPLGFALEFRRLVPELAEAGRKQVDFSRSLGRAALRTLSKAGDASAAQRSRPASAQQAESTGAADGTEAAAGDGSGDVVAGYDELTAKQVIAIAGDASAAQLVWMRDRELETKNRKTVFAAIDRSTDDGD